MKVSNEAIAQLHEQGYAVVEGFVSESELQPAPDYEAWGARWRGKIAWPSYALSSEWIETMERATPRERALFGFPGVGDPYWDEQTLRDVQARYPNMDLGPYRDACAADAEKDFGVSRSSPTPAIDAL